MVHIYRGLISKQSIISKQRIWFLLGGLCGSILSSKCCHGLPIRDSALGNVGSDDWIGSSASDRPLRRVSLMINSKHDPSTSNASSPIAQMQHDSKLKRSQFTSCDSCRQSRVSCDASKQGRQPNHVSWRGPCSRCVRRKRPCTFQVWKRSCSMMCRLEVTIKAQLCYAYDA
jgi:hypothetical protein